MEITINQLKKIFKKAIRSIPVTGSTSRQPSNPLYYDLKILPYNLLQKPARLHFMHSMEYNYAPKTFRDEWKKNEARNLNYELRNNDHFTIPKINFSTLSNCPYFAYPLEWNNLGDLRLQNNKITFQINLEFNLLEELAPTIPHIPTLSSPSLPPSTPNQH